jgi:hypothetical protein
MRPTPARSHVPSTVHRPLPYPFTMPATDRWGPPVSFTPYLTTTPSTSHRLASAYVPHVLRRLRSAPLMPPPASLSATTARARSRDPPAPKSPSREGHGWRPHRPEPQPSHHRRSRDVQACRTLAPRLYNPRGRSPKTLEPPQGNFPFPPPPPSDGRSRGGEEGEKEEPPLGIFAKPPPVHRQSMQQCCTA